MGTIHSILVTAALAAGLALPGCTGFSGMLSGDTTTSKVYDLGEVSAATLTDAQMQTFSAMVRDVVGQEEWTRVGSSIHVLNDVLLVRTSADGHDSLGRFFSQFRAINDTPRPGKP